MAKALPIAPGRVAGLNLTVGGFLPRVRLPSLAGPTLTPADLVDEGALAICIYNPTDVNPFPLPPKGVDLPRRYAMLRERQVALFVISGLSLPRLGQWVEMIGLDIYALSDADSAFARQSGIPIKRVGDSNFRTHVAFILQEDRILSILLETDPIHNFESLLAALDVAEGQEPGAYDLPDQPWHAQRRGEEAAPEAEEAELPPEPEPNLISLPPFEPDIEWEA